MFLPSKKNISTVIQARSKGELESMFEAKPEEKIGEGGSPFTELAEKMMQAMQEKSVMTLSEALENLCKYIEAKDYKQDNEE